MKIIISGADSFSEVEFIEMMCQNIISKEQFMKPTQNFNLEIISPNNPRGADWIAERWARKNNLHLKLFPPQWNNDNPVRPKGWGSKPILVSRKNYYNSYNSLAGYLRNQEIADYVMDNGGGIAIIFNSDKSNKHVKDLISRLKKAWVKVYNIKCEDLSNYKIEVYNENLQKE